MVRSSSLAGDGPARPGLSRWCPAPARPMIAPSAMRGHDRCSRRRSGGGGSRSARNSSARLRPPGIRDRRWARDGADPGDEPLDGVRRNSFATAAGSPALGRLETGQRSAIGLLGLHRRPPGQVVADQARACGPIEQPEFDSAAVPSSTSVVDVHGRPSRRQRPGNTPSC